MHCFGEGSPGKAWMMGVTLALATGAAQAGSTVFGLAAGHDDNVTNVPYEPALSSEYFELSAGHLWQPHVGPRSGLELGLSGLARNIQQHQGLSWAALDASLGGWWLLGGGFSAPVVYLDLGLQAREYQSQERDQNRWRAGLTLVQRLTTKISAQLQAGLESRDAEGPAFDGDMLRYGLGLRWQPLDGISFDARYEQLDGDVDVSVGRFFSEVNSVSEVVQQDDALPGFLAYRVEADGDAMSLGLNLRWGPNATVRLHGLWAETRSKRSIMVDDGPGPGPDGPDDDPGGPGPGPGPDDPGPDDPGPGPEGPGDAGDGLDMYPTYERRQIGISLTVRF